MLQAECKEPGDRVKDDPATSTFKAVARLHQARWREARDYPMGTHPLNPQRKLKKKTSEEKDPHPVGCNLEFGFATREHVNFVSDGARQAVADRLGAPQKGQMLDDERLYASRLSSMPMCSTCSAAWARSSRPLPR